jgi:hypothetical protein
MVLMFFPYPLTDNKLSLIITDRNQTVDLFSSWIDNFSSSHLLEFLPETMGILPILFDVSHKEMLSHLYLMVSEELLAIQEKYNKLIVSLRTAQAKEYSLDKKQTSYDDLLDALRLSLKGYNIK